MQKLISLIQKHQKIVLVITAAVVLIISCYFGFQEKTSWSSEKYGTTSDGQIAIKENSQVAVKFKIQKNGFSGIYVRISPITKYFTKEKLLFTLIDDQTGKVIAQYEMLMKNEMLNTDAFADLPVSDSKDKKVTLYINGKDISIVPYLSVSKESNISSKLYIDDKKNDDDLVFSAVYKEKSRYNVDAFVKGGIIILLLCIIGFFTKTDALVYNQSSGNDSCIPVMVKNKKRAALYWGLTFLVYFFLVFFVYKTYIIKILERREDVEIVKESIDDEDIILDSNNIRFENIIKANKNSLTSLSYQISVKNTNNKARIHIYVSDDSNGYEYYNGIISLKSISGDGQAFVIHFQKEYVYSKDRKIRVVMEAEDFDETQLVIKAGKYSKKSECTINGEKLSCSPMVTTSFCNNDFVKGMYAIYVLIVFLLLFFVMYCVYIKDKTVEQYFVVLSLIIGLIYLLVIPVYVVPDENTHADSAYIISNKILGIAESDKPSYIYKRTCDVQTEYANEHDGKLYMYRRICGLFDQNEERGVLEECFVNNAIANASTFFYLPAAFGISLARLLRLSSYMLLLFGRLFNYLVYVLFTYLGIKKMPYKKELLCIFALLPISVQQAASFSYDSILNGLSFLFIGYCLFFIMENKYNTLDIIVFLISMMLMSYIKGGVYMPLCFLAILIPIEKGVKMDRKLILRCVVLVGFILCSYVHRNIAQMIQRLYLSAGTNINDFNGKSLFTLSDIINSPLMAVKMYINTVIDRTDFYVQTMLGGQLGSFNMTMSWWNIFVYILIIYTITAVQIKEVKLKTISKILICILSLGSFCLVLLSMFVSSTNITSTVITGVQGRYFLPIVILPLIVISLNNYIFIKEDSEINARKRIRNSMIVFFLNHIYMLLYIVIVVANKK